MGKISIIAGEPSLRHELPFRSFDFSGGEIQVRLETCDAVGEITINAMMTLPHDIMELLLVTNAVRHQYPSLRLHLYCPYLPYARQDRVCVPGEAFSLEVMCSLINLQRYETVTVLDVHSQKSLDLLNNAVNVPVVDLINESIIGNAVLVCPDKGAIERVGACAERFNRPMIIAEKIRNPDTGAITHTELHMNGVDVTGKDLIMIDDICDGGRTFIEHAKLLRPLSTGKISLWVTHLIASQGFEVFNGLIDDIYTANCFHRETPDFVHLI